MSTTTTTTNLKVTMVYLDATTRNYSINDVGTLNVADVKSAISAFNTAAQDSTSDICKTFVSDDGARVTSIREAQIVTITEEVIYGG